MDFSDEENTPATVNNELASDEESPTDNSFKALLTCDSDEDEFQYDPSTHVKTLGHHIMDKKRLRVFTSITKKKEKQQPTKK